ncbi:serine/threonine-protein kinase BRSK2-like [Thrips palmi]|uniref:non-specific serine/threonine protein kinase n=1 Tax=Thrips palmi TaxID=161013 RepID=A0A6P9ACT1_THRPL|nr:serine/threonine-protein kinase BRSK2-like [Thrips palmi]
MTYRLNDFDVLELIGSGSFGSCYKVRNRHTHEIIVWKVIEYGCLSEEKKQLLVTEVSLLRDLRHPHIVRYFDRIVCKETKQLYILIEYCPGGDLATVIKTCVRNNTYVEERFVWKVLYQLISALQTCHSWVSSTVILHRDIKPANVFLDDSGNVKLGDFGLACKLDADQPGCIETMVGTPFYMSPEVLKGEMYDSKSDVWSLGCLVYELCARKPPFHAHNITELASKVSKGRYERIPHNYSDSLQKVLSSLLQVNQDQRPSIFDLICHPVILSNLPVESDGGISCKIARRPPPPPPVVVSSRAPPPSPVDRDPERVSKDAFQSEWLARLQSLRDKEASLRHRELELDEREHSLNRREHRLALMERAVRDKMVLAEVYLKRSKENRCGPTSVPRPQPQAWNEIDESFSADAGDTSVMPTSALMDPKQVPRPPNFVSKPENSAVFQGRHVYFDDPKQPRVPPQIPAKPSFAKIAEAIRSNRAQIDTETKPRMQQKILHLPGYTGPAITVDVPISETSDFPLGPDLSPLPDKPQPSSPSVKLTVLFDDREELHRATSRIDALNLESKRPVLKGHQTKDLYNKTDVSPAQAQLMRQNTFTSTAYNSRSIGASVDSLLDAKHPSSPHKINTLPEKFPFPSEVVLRKNAFGGSARRRRKSSCRSSTPQSSESKSSLENGRENVENAKNHAMLLYHKGNKTLADGDFSRRRSFTSVKGKENLIGKDMPPIPKKQAATSLLALPSNAAAAASAVVSRSKKSHVSFLR